jgi:hypothetical protein
MDLNLSGVIRQLGFRRWTDGGLVTVVPLVVKLFWLRLLMLS